MMSGSNDQSYMPLAPVKTYREGFLRLQGCISFACLAFLSAGLLVLYELLIINVEDQDFRDMLFDYRITRAGVSHQHRHFANAHMCGCHSDPAVFSFNCTTPVAMKAAFPQHPAPHCPPAVLFTCPDLLSQPCHNLRAKLYPAAGLNASTGAPKDCSRAGRVVVRARQGPAYSLQALWWGPDNGTAPQLRMAENAYDGALIQHLVDAAAAHADPMFVVPSQPLAASVSVDGTSVPLAPAWQPEGYDKGGAFGWPAELWPWPPSSSCSNTSQPAALWFEGDVALPFSAFQANASRPQPVFRFAVNSSSGGGGGPVAVPQFIIAAPSGARLAQPAPAHMALLQAAEALPSPPAGDAAAAAAAAAGAFPLQDGYAGAVAVLGLSSVNLSLALVAPLGGCGAWQLHAPGIAATYGRQVWQGTLQQLQALAGQASEQRPAAGTWGVAVSLHDAAEPRPLALPRYAGEVYVYAALVLGGVWLFTAALLVILLGIVVLNVQRNRGLPLFLYKYMRKYRGW